MKITIIKVTLSSGISSKTKEPFSMPRALALIPVELSNSTNYKVLGAGFSAYEYDVADNFIDDFITRFKTDFKGLPVVYDLDTQPRERGNHIILGFSEHTRSSASIPPVQPQPVKA